MLKIKDGFIGYAAFSGLVHLSIKLGWVLGMEPAVQRHLGTEEWGRFFSAYSLAGMLLVIIDAGLSIHLTRVLSTQPESMPKTLKQQLVLKFGLFVLYGLCLWAGHALLQWPDDQLVLLMLLGVFQGFLSWNGFLRIFLAAKGKFRGEAILANVDKFTLLLALGLAFGLGAENLIQNGLYYSALLAAVAFISWTITFWIVFAQIGISGQWFALSDWISWLKKGLPYALLTLMMGMYLRLELVWMRTFLPDGSETDQAMGMYAAAWRPLEAFFQFSALFSIIVLPMAARWLHHKKDVSTLWWTVVSSMGLMAWALAGLLWWAPLPLTSALYRSDLIPTAQIMSALAPGLMGLSLSLIAGTFLTAAGKIRILIAVALLTCCVQFAADWFWIPTNHGIGAAWAFSLGQWVSALSLMGAAYRFNLIQFRHSAALRTTFLLVCCISFPAMFVALKGEPKWAWILLPLFMGIAAPALMWSIWKHSTDVLNPD